MPDSGYRGPCTPPGDLRVGRREAGRDSVMLRRFENLDEMRS